MGGHKMYWSSFLFQVITIFYSSINLSRGQSLRPGNEPMLFIGVFQDCPDDKEHDIVNNAKICKAAIDVAYQNKTQFWKGLVAEFDIGDVMFPEDVEYLRFDICSFEDAVQLGLDLKLNQIYFVSNSTQKIPEWNKIRINHWQRKSRIFHIVIQASSLISHFFEQYFYGNLYGVSFLNTNFNLQSSLSGKNLISYNGFINFNAQDLTERLALSGVTNFGILYFKQSSSLYQIEFESFYRHVLLIYQKYQICHILYDIDTSNETAIDLFLQHFNKNIHLEMVVVIGDPDLQNEFFLKIQNNYNEAIRRTFVFYDMYLQAHWYFYHHTFYTYSVPLLKYTGWTSPLQYVAKLTPEQSVLAKYCYDSYQAEILRMISLIVIRLDVGVFKWMSFDGFKESTLRRFKFYKSGRRVFSLLHSKYEGGFEIKHYDEEYKRIIYSYRTMICVRPSCSTGFEPYFGYINQTEGWMKQYGHGCRMCSDKHFKSETMVFNSSCQRCPDMFLSTEDRTHCFDPYTKDYVKFRNMGAMINIAICGIGLGYSTFAIALLLIFRNTPFVKASNMGYCILHLVLSCCQFISLPLLFFEEPTKLKCFLRPVMTLTFCTYPSILILIKSQKILAAFNAKVVLSSSEKNKSTLLQFFIVMSFMLVESSVLLWTLMIKTPEVIRTFDHSKYEISMDCNTGFHINAQVLLIIIQHLFSAAQAYRGRNLPGPFNEAMPIAYSTLAVTFAYIIVFPLYYLQRDKEIKRTIQIFILAIAQTLFLFIFYGAKIHILLCQKHKNTKMYFRAQMWKRSQDKVSSKINRSSTR